MVQNQLIGTLIATVIAAVLRQKAAGETHMRKHEPTRPNDDKPIPKPFEQLPEWFMLMLNSRFTTKKLDDKERRGVTTGKRADRRAA